MAIARLTNRILAGFLSFFLILGVFVFKVPIAQAAVSVDAATLGTTLSSNPVTFSHTCTGSNLMLIVAVDVRGSNSVVANGVTYNGVNATFLRSDTTGSAATDARTEIWTLQNPATGANTVSVTGAIATGRIVVAANCASGVSGLGNNNGAHSSGTALSTTLASAAGEVVIDTADTVSSGVVTSLVAGGSQTGLYSQNDVAAGNVRGAGSTQPGAASVTMTWTSNPTDPWAQSVVALQPTAAPSAAADSYTLLFN